MLQFIATNAVISRGFDNKAALKFSDDGNIVRFRIGERVYDKNAENNTRWINLNVKAFGNLWVPAPRGSRSLTAEAVSETVKALTAMTPPPPPLPQARTFRVTAALAEAALSSATDPPGGIPAHGAHEKQAHVRRFCV